MDYAPLISSVTRVYDSWIIRTYIALRFRIINRRILDEILKVMKPDRDLLVLGCGFGLFDLLLGLRWPQKRIYGVDRDESRIEAARCAASRLGLHHNVFEVLDLTDKGVPKGSFDEILMLDILHHVPRSEHERLLRSCWQVLRPGGCLVIKDVHREAKLKLFFTWLLDMLMTGWEPVYYRDESGVCEELREIGFARVTTIRIDDILPYPHVQYVCVKEGP